MRDTPAAARRATYSGLRVEEDLRGIDCVERSR
jgi:hypothetical protein